MDYLSISTANIEAVTPQYPIQPRLKEFLKQNKNKIEKQYTQYSKVINGSHFFIRLLHGFYGYFGDCPEDTYYNLKFNYEDLASQYQLVSAGTKPKPQTLFYGQDYLVAVDEYSVFNQEISKPDFLAGNLKHLSLYKPLTLLHHEDMQFFPNLITDKEEKGHSISVINLPLLGAMLHQWYNENENVERPETLQDFITQFIYLPIVDDVLDIAFLNRLTQCIKLGSVVYLDNARFTLENNDGFGGYLVSLNELTNELLSEVANEIAKEVKGIGDTLVKIPGLSKENLLSLYPLYSNNGQLALEWPNAAIQGWLLNTLDIITNQLNMTLIESDLRTFSKKMKYSYRKSLSSFLPKEDLLWFENNTTI